MDPNPSLQQWYLLDGMYRPYPSLAPSDPSPAPRQAPPLDPYTAFVDPMPSDFDQIPSSIGPSRIPRRQQLPGGQRRRNSLQMGIPRDDSPYSSYPGPLHLQSPVYNPGTPASLDSYSHRARPRSDSFFTQHAPSPAPSSGSSSQPSSGRPESSKSRRDNPPKHTKHRLRDADRKNICLYHLNHPHARQEDIGAVFRVERSTISKILKDKEKWLNLTEEEANDPLSKHRPSKFPEVEEEMLKSLQAWADQGTNITDQLIRTHALDIAKSFGISADRFKGSSGWIENFKHRHDIKRGEWLKAVRSPPNAGTHPLSFGPPTASSSGAPPPPTPVIMPYDQRMEGVPSSSSSSSSSDPSRIHEAHWTQDATQSSPLIHASGSSGPIDVQDTTSSAVAHTPLRTHSRLQSIQHSPEDGPDAYAAQALVGYAPPHPHHHQSHMYADHAHGMAGLVVADSPTVGRPPTLQEANDAMDLVIEYLDKVGPVDLIKGNERQVMSDIKCALFSLVGGVSYARPLGSA